MFRRSDKLDSVIGRLPDWMPLGYTDALKLYNEHGKTYLANDYICVLRPVLKVKTENYLIEADLYGKTKQ